MTNKKYGGRTSTRGKTAHKSYPASGPKVRVLPSSASYDNAAMADFKIRLGTGYGKRPRPTGKRTGGGF